MSDLGWCAESHTISVASLSCAHRSISGRVEMRRCSLELDGEIWNSHAIAMPPHMTQAYVQLCPVRWPMSSSIRAPCGSHVEAWMVTNHWNTGVTAGV